MRRPRVGPELLKAIRAWALGATAACGLSACVGPLILNETARSVGRGRHEISGGYGTAGLGLKWNAGVTDDLDVGFQWESLSMGLRAKYAFLNRGQRELSFAGALGAGLSFGGTHYYGDAIASYLAGDFEPYAAIRYVHVSVDPIEARGKDTSYFRIDGPQFDYGQGILGFRYWVGHSTFLSAEASGLAALSSGLGVVQGVFVTAAIGGKF